VTQTDTAAPPEPVDWDLAERVARRFAGREPIATSYLGGSLHSDFSTVTTHAEQLVGDFTGLHAPGAASACVLDRPQWVHANVASMRRMLHPLTARVAERMARSPVAPIGRRVAGTEMGVLLGFMAQRVLGQYDLLVPEDPDTSDDRGAVYYVGANILALEKRYAFRPHDFRLWIALHEVTHSAQFTAIPWLKEYFLSLVQAMMRAADELRKGHNPLDDGGLVALFASSEQRGVLAKVQALMSLLEGHGNSVMNELGRVHIAGQERMARVLQARRRSRGVAGILYKLLGFESKLRQYEIGEAFVAEVVRVGGPRAIDAAWRGPEYLPTMDEFARPTEWLTRVA
jgi:coenzyme F420 biosynthesis associated uncharacterized protein